MMMMFKKKLEIHEKVESYGCAGGDSARQEKRHELCLVYLGKSKEP